MKLTTSLVLIGLITGMASSALAQDNKQQDKKQQDSKQQQDNRSRGNASAPTPARTTPAPARKAPVPQPVVRHDPPAQAPSNNRQNGNGNAYLSRARDNTLYGSASSMNQATFGTNYRQPSSLNSRPVATHGPVQSSPVWSSSGQHDGNRQSDTGGDRNHQSGSDSDRFRYSHYETSPDRRAYRSPGYLYGTVPGYIDLGFTLGNVGVNFAWGSGQSYDWAPHRAYYSGYNSYASLDNSVDSIVDGFNLRQPSRFDSLLPSSQCVSIDMNGQAPYSITDGDFQSMLADIMNSTNTVSYGVTNVWRNGNSATVEAVHTFRDSDGSEQQVRHLYGLQGYDGSFRITSFKTESM